MLQVGLRGPESTSNTLPTAAKFTLEFVQSEEKGMNLWSLLHLLLEPC